MKKDENTIAAVKKISPQATKIVEQFQIAPTDAEMIIASYSETVKSLSELDKDFKKFAKVKEITEEISADAKALRLLYVKVRTSTEATHKKIKADVLLRSRAIDGAKNIFMLQLSERETPLMEIEKHFEKLEDEKKQKLKAERIEKLKKFITGEQNAIEALAKLDDLYLDQMTTEIWDSFYAGEKAKFDTAQAKIKKDAEDEKKAIEEKELHEKRVKDLYDTGAFEFFPKPMSSLHEMTQAEFEKDKKEGLKRKKEKDDANEKIRKDNVKLAKDKEIAEARSKKDQAIADKKLADQKAKADADATVAQKKIDDLKKADDDRIAKEADDKVKADDDEKATAEKEEKAKKNKKYSDWLAKHDLKPEDIGSGAYFILRDGEAFRLCKEIDRLTIKTNAKI